MTAIKSSTKSIIIAIFPCNEFISLLSISIFATTTVELNEIIQERYKLCIQFIPNMFLHIRNVRNPNIRFINGTK